MFFYLAKSPYPISCFNVFSRIIALNFISGKLGKLILPAQNNQPDLFFNAEESLQFAPRILNGTVITFDKAHLDTIEIIPELIKDYSVQNQRFIIKFKGNRGFYENTLSDFVNDATMYKAIVIGFNYRGVGKSQKPPSRFQDLVTDGIAQVQRILDLGANSKNILLDGESLGGAVATMVAHHFHKNNIPVYLWNSRSFSVLSSTAVSMIRLKLPNTIKIFLRGVLKISGWDVDAGSAYLQINSHYKGYMVVEKESHRSNGDGTIPHLYSLHETVQAQETKQSISTGHTVLSQNITCIGHMEKRENLISSDSPLKNGQDLFGWFVSKLGS